MKIRPLLAFHAVGMPHTLRLNPSLIYPAIHATNQPDWKAKGKIFVSYDPADTMREGDSILLENGDYTIIEP